MSAAEHNAAILPIMRMIVDHASDEGDHWVLLETLCLGVGRLHGRTDRQTAEFIDTMAQRIATGERA